MAARRCWATSSPTPTTRAPRRSLAGAGAVGRDRLELLGGRPVDLATALLRRAAIKDVGGFDEGLDGSVERDLLLRLTRDHEPLAVDVPVLKRPDPSARGLADDWDSVVLERQLVDWDAAAARTTSDDLVSHVLPRGPEPRRTVEWLGSVPREGAELVLVGRPPAPRAPRAGGLDRRGHLRRPLRVGPGAVSMSAATNVGIAQAAGSTVLLVRPEAMPPRQPIAERLAAVVREPGVAVAQPLVVDLDGVSSARAPGSAADNPHPELFLAGPAHQRRRADRPVRGRRPGGAAGGAAHRDRRRPARASAPASTPCSPRPTSGCARAQAGLGGRWSCPTP